MNSGQVPQALVDLYKTQLERWYKRRADEWAVTLSFWTSIVIATSLLAGKFQTTGLHLVGYVVVWMFYALLWAQKVSQANSHDKSWADVYLSKIQVTLGIPNVTEKTYREPTRWQFMSDWSFRAKAIFTAGFLALNWFVLFVVPLVPVQKCVP